MVNNIKMFAGETATPFTSYREKKTMSVTYVLNINTVYNIILV